METPTFFLNNIKNSRNLIASKKRKISDYWLNPDGTVSSKKTWLTRAVRWIQNLLFNKTISDTWSIFEKTIKYLEKKRSNLEEGEKKSLRFITKFFRELKPELNRLLKADPKKAEFLESRLQTECGDLIEDALVTVYAQSRFVNLEKIKKIPLKKKTGSVLNGDIEKLKNIYDKIPLDQKSTKLLLQKIEDNFWNVLLGCANSFVETGELKEKKPLHICSCPKLLGQEPPKQKQLSDFFFAVKQHLREHFEREEDQGFSLETYFDIILKKTLHTLDPKTSLLKLYEASKQRDLFHVFIDRVKNRDSNVPGVTERNIEEYYGQIEFYLQKILNAVPPKKKLNHIIKKERPSKLGINEIQKALRELAEASEQCFAAWVWESREQCRILKIDYPENEPFQDIEEHLLNESHHLKESLVIESIRDDDAIHYLNGFKCSEEGRSLGFSDALAAKDPFRIQLNTQQKRSLKDYILEQYPANLLRLVNKNYPQFGLENPPTFPKSMEFLEKNKFFL